MLPQISEAGRFVLQFLLTSCTSPPPPPSLTFVRGGIVAHPATPEGRLLPEERTLIERDWHPGETIAAGGAEEIAPQKPDCVTLFSVPLGTPRLGGDSPDTALAFSPDGQTLAVGTFTGDILAIDAWSGEVRASRHLSEALVRQVAFSPDGSVLYAAEQSPDALVHALDPSTLQTRAAHRLADDVGSSPMPDPSDPYGVYTLPSAYGMEVLPDGSLLVAATHGWGPFTDRRNASRVLLLRQEGDTMHTIAAWPAQGSADVVLGAMAVGNDRVTVALRRSASGPPPADLPVDGLLSLSLPGLSRVGEDRFTVLGPHFQGVFVWDALALGDDFVAVGMGDGRLWARTREGGEAIDQIESLGTPILAGDAPIYASVGFLRYVSGSLFALTSRTAIPYGSASPDLRPQAPHPGENTLWRYDRTEEGFERGASWRGPHSLSGLATSKREIAVAAGPRGEDSRRDLFGALIFAHDASEPTTFCATRGPSFHRLALAEDGRVAVAEVPWREGDTVQGEYRVTVLR